MFFRRIVLLLGLVAVASACDAAASGQGVDPPDTAAVGELPPAFATTEVTAPQSTVVRTTVPLPVERQVGARVAGNRIIVIGDSVMASTSQRYGGEMCATLQPLGWQTEVDAETGRFIDFGDQVLDKRLSAGWDVGVIMLGNNYGDNQDVYRQYLDDMVVRLSPAPVVLLTVSEFKPSRTQVNAVVFEMAAKYANVVVVDWAAVTAADPTLTGDDGLHLTDAGRAALAGQVALALGPAPVQPGDCLSSTFRDDSAGNDKVTVAPKKTTTTVAGTATTVPRTTVPVATTVPVVTTPVPTTPVVTSPPPASTDAPPSTDTGGGAGEAPPAEPATTV